MARKADNCALSGLEGGRKLNAHRTSSAFPQATYYSVVARFSFFVIPLTMIFFFGAAGGTEMVKAPLIEPAQESIVVERGHNLTLTCRGKHRVRWLIDNESSSPIGRIVTDKTKDLPYTATLHLVHLNYTDVSFFGCTYFLGHRDEVLDIRDPLVARIYVFVKDESHLLVSDMEGEPSFSNFSGNPIMVPCKPTFPEVKVIIQNDITREELEGKQDNFYGINILPDDTGHHRCVASYKDKIEEQYFTIRYQIRRSLPEPILKVEDFWQNINSMKYDVIRGTNVTITCEIKDHEVLYPEWHLPPSINETGNIPAHRYTHRIEDGAPFHMISSIPLVDVDTDVQGTYKCYLMHKGQFSNYSSVTIEVVSEESPYLELTLKDPEIINQTLEDSYVLWSFMYRAYPQPTFKFSKNDKILVQSQGEYKTVDEHYLIEVERKTGHIYVEIKSPTLEDVGAYKFQAYQQNNVKTLPLTLLLQGSPQDVQVELILGGEATLVGANKTFGVKCQVKAYPPPVITLEFAECVHLNECQEYRKIGNKTQSKARQKELKGVFETEWRLKATSPGKFQCRAHNVYSAEKSGEQILMISDAPSLEAVVIDVESLDNQEDIVEGDNVTLKCYINKLLDATNIQWYYQNRSAEDEEGFQVSKSSTVYSEVLELRLTNVIQSMSGLFMCGDQEREETHNKYDLIVEALEAPTWSTPDGSQPLRDVTVNETGAFILDCSARGQPKPVITWIKDGEPFTESPEATITRNKSAINFSSIKPEDAGTYICKVSNRKGEIFAQAKVIVNADSQDNGKTNDVMSIVVGVLATIIFATCLYFIIRLFRDKRERHLIKLADQRAFEEGDPMNLNPELGLGEQAELLPYSPKWELAKEQIVFERMLGSGAFGKVYKASVANLIPGQSKTTVAVKMMKCRGDKEQLKALRSELKIMIHIGRHINIVNLLGACSKNMAVKGELLLVVEYCKYGCLLSYMQRHRREFINQINPVTDKIDQTIISNNDVRCRQRSGSLLSRRAVSRQSRIKYAALQFNPDGITYTAEPAGTMSDSSSKPGSPQVTSPTLKSNTSGISYPETVDTSVGSPVPNKDQVSCNGDSDPFSFMKNGFSTTSYRQRSGSGSSMGLMSDMTCMTMESSGASDGYVRGVPGMATPLCSKDLLCWAYQIARGMEYLSFRKVLHGDLAARNILLDENHIVKISDFGLAKDIYKNDYFKQSEGHLPVKWLSIEAIRDRIFSTQSDVWSYGVVLWEIFSLGQTPYPGLEFDMEFLRNLEKGMRMEQPPYATYELYQMMLDCWHDDPRQRPRFSELEEALGGMIGETEKQFYLDLNNGIDSSTPEVDYLSLMRSPDYNSIIRETTPDDGGGYVVAHPSCEDPEAVDIPTIDSNTVTSPKPLFQQKPSVSLSRSFSHGSDCLQTGTLNMSNEVFHFTPDTNQQDENGEEGAEKKYYRKKSSKDSSVTDGTYLQMNSPKDKKDTPHFVYPELTSSVPKLLPVQHTLSTNSGDSGFSSPPITQTNPCYLHMTSNQSTTQDKELLRTNSCQKPPLKPKPVSPITDANYVNFQKRLASSCSSGLGSVGEEDMEESVTVKIKGECRDNTIAEEIMPIEIV
ncbi:vascular endothelial growth factor receptor 1-like isoform X2 [Oratosquilla oratoria]|uniref:vascular endothelial growth factor receptor 1-like isoform X2 n=1 Tax=Oratosquilla oratoria TaxID=337810 RepID=UPI003F75B136